jgi:hypothetical protein
MNESNPTQPNDASHRGHEPDVVNSRLLIISGAGLVLLVALALLLVYATNRFLADQMPRAAEKPPGVRPTYTRTAPQITSAQPHLLRELRQSEQQRLTTYEWIDQPAGIARIPIDRAVDILAKKGLPTGVSRSEEHDDSK